MDSLNIMYMYVFIVFFHLNKVMTMTYLTKVLDKNIRHPFRSCKTTHLNYKAFVGIDGMGPFEEYTWNGDYLDVDVSVGCAEDIHDRYKKLKVELYEDNDAITLVKSGYGFIQGYMYPKEYFSLVEDQAFKVQLEKYEKGESIRVHLSKRQQLKNVYPKEIFNLIKNLK